MSLEGTWIQLKNTGWISRVCGSKIGGRTWEDRQGPTLDEDGGREKSVDVKQLCYRDGFRVLPGQQQLSAKCRTDRFLPLSITRANDVLRRWHQIVGPYCFVSVTALKYLRPVAISLPLLSFCGNKVL